MSFLDFLLKKKKSEKELYKFRVSREFKTVLNKEEDEEGNIITNEYVMAKDICSHLKVKGTKYYALSSDARYPDESIVDLYIRCRYIQKGNKNKSIREPLIDTISSFNNLEFCSVHPTSSGHLSCIVNMRGLLDNHRIDYILIDIDEATGECYFYYSFKGVMDKNEVPIEGYLVVNAKEKELNKYFCSLM